MKSQLSSPFVRMPLKSSPGRARPPVTASKLFELIRSERGKRYTVKGSFTVSNAQGKTLTIPDGYEHDRYSIVKDLPDVKPAVAHDYASDPNPETGSGRRWDDGTEITRADADHLFGWLMATSDDAETREKSVLYLNGIRFFGGPLWHLGTLRQALRNAFKDFRP